MADNLKKSQLAAVPRFVIGSIPGQVPSRENLAIMREAMKPPPKWTPAQMVEHNGAYLSPRSVVDGLGLGAGQEAEWVKHLAAASKGANELSFRHEIMSKMLQERMDGTRRQALFQRAMRYYRDMRKSMVAVVEVDDLLKSGSVTSRNSRKREAREASLPESGKFGKRHFPPPGSRDSRNPGDLYKSIVRRARLAPDGVHLSELDDLVREHGKRSVAKCLEKACSVRGGLRYKNGVLKPR